MNDFRSNSFRDALFETVQSRDENRVALDLGLVDFLSSSGVAILVGLKRRLDAKQGKLVLFRVQPVVQDLLRITRLTQYFAFANEEIIPWFTDCAADHRTARCRPPWSRRFWRACSSVMRISDPRWLPNTWPRRVSP